MTRASITVALCVAAATVRALPTRRDASTAAVSSAASLDGVEAVARTRLAALALRPSSSTAVISGKRTP